MNNISFKIAAAIIVSIGLFASSANASVTTYGCYHANILCTLEELFEGAYFDVDGLRFNHWEFVSSDSTIEEPQNHSWIRVRMYDAAHFDDDLPPVPGEGPGFYTSSMEEVYGAEYSDFRYKFEVSTLGNHGINSNLLNLNRWHSTSDAVGLIEVNERVTNSQSIELATKRDFVEISSEEPPYIYDFKEFEPHSKIFIETGFREEGSPLNDDSLSLGIGSYLQRFGYVDVLTPVAVDIKPRKNPKNVIDLKKDRELKVAIVGEATFDALQVDPATVRFGPSEASPINFKGQDYNRDGFSDLILIFNLSETGISCGDESATLTGDTFPDPVINITGSDSFTVKPCP